MQHFLDESGLFNLFIFIFFFFFFFFCVLCRNSKWPPKNLFIFIFFFFFFFFFAFYAETQNGHQKWQENYFWEKSPVDSADNLRVQIFVQIVPSLSFSEIITLLCFTQKFKMAAQRGRKKVASRLALSRSLSKINTFFVFNAEIQDGCQKWQENNFYEKLPVDTADTLRVKNCLENCFYLAPFPR